MIRITTNVTVEPAFSTNTRAGWKLMDGIIPFINHIVLQYFREWLRALRSGKKHAQ